MKHLMVTVVRVGEVGMKRWICGAIAIVVAGCGRVAGDSPSMGGSNGLSDFGGSGGVGGREAGGAPSAAAGATSQGGRGSSDAGADSAGSSDVSGGAAGVASDDGALHVTLSHELPATPLALTGLLVAVDSDDGAVVVGPSSDSSAADPGPSITWFPRGGAMHTVVFTGAVTPAAMALDGGNAIWLAGQLYRNVTFGSSTLAPIDNGYYLAKLSADGSPQWTIAVPRSDTTFVQAIATDPAGNAYVVGGSSVTTAPFASGAFVTKFSPAGVALFDRNFAGGDTEASVQSLAIAGDGNLVIAGFFNSTLTIGATILTSQAGLSTNGFVAFLAAADGAPSSALSFGGAIFDAANSVQVTADGSLRLTGTLSGQSAIGGRTVNANSSGAGFVAELGRDSTVHWIDVLDGPSFLPSSATNANERTFAVGHTEVGGQAVLVTSTGPDGTSQIPVHVLNNDGNGATTVAADHHGGAWVGGEFQGNVDFGLGKLSGSDPTLHNNFIIHLEP